MDPEETEITQKIIGSVLTTILASYEDVRGCSGVGRGGRVSFGLFVLYLGWTLTCAGDRGGEWGSSPRSWFGVSAQTQMKDHVFEALNQVQGAAFVKTWLNRSFLNIQNGKCWEFLSFIVFM